MFCMFLIIFNIMANQKNITEQEYCEKIEQIKNPKFTKTEEVTGTQSEICIGLVLIQKKMDSELEDTFRTGVTKMIGSVFKHTEESLHFIILTDEESLHSVGEFLAQIVTAMLGTQAVLSRLVGLGRLSIKQ